jgi:predicted CXXCH cytochrome family protein
VIRKGMDCLGCHEPHHSTGPGLLVASAHPPFGDRDCASCHDGTAPIADQRQTCLQCHDGLPEPAAAGQTVHAPFAEGDCSSCHNPHVARGPALLPTNADRRRLRGMSRALRPGAET